jgi:hypothetical protein
MATKRIAPTNLMEKMRAGQFGNVKLLALTVGILALCALIFVFKGNTTQPSDASSAISPLEQDSPESVAEKRAQDTHNQSAGAPQKTAGTVNPPPPSPEEIQDTFREMAEKLPDGEVIIY